MRFSIDGLFRYLLWKVQPISVELSIAIWLGWLTDLFGGVLTG